MEKQTPFHSGELAIQRTVGVEAMAARVGNAIHTAITPGFKTFLENQDMAALASIDAGGQLWGSLLVAHKGFIEVLDPYTVRIQAMPLKGDPLYDNLIRGGEIGLIGIEFAQRRRVRLNGRAEILEDGAFLIHTKQVFGNCPKYIQARSSQDVSNQLEVGVGEYQRSSTLNPKQAAWIEDADTFFVGSAHPEGGADISHRGGRPGFVRVDGNRLVWPDYAGNMMFNTLGNIAGNPNVGLLFIDFDRGNLLHLTGKAEIIWDVAQIVEFAGAERLIAFEVEEVIQRDGVVPLRWLFQDFSPYNP